MLVPPERFELPTPAFVAQCSNPNELRWCIEFESSSITVIATIDPCNKAGREGDTPLGILNTQIDYLVVYGITPPVLYTRLTFEESSQRVFFLLTLSKLGADQRICTSAATSIRRSFGRPPYLLSAKTWCPGGESNTRPRITKPMFYH